MHRAPVRPGRCSHGRTEAKQTNDWSIEIPGLLSVLGTHSLHGQVKGLADIPVADQPPMLPLLYYAFRVMAGIGFLFMVLAFWTAFAMRKARGRLERAASATQIAARMGSGHSAALYRG